MVTYSENLQYSIATLNYYFLGIKTMITIVDKVPENLQHEHDGQQKKS